MKRWSIAFVALSLLLGGCGGQAKEGAQGAGGPADRSGARLQGAADQAGGAADEEKPQDGPTYEASDVDRGVVKAHNAFAFALFRDVVARESGEPANVFLSPVSAALALAMSMNGADGETLDAMRAGLRMDGLAEGDINRSHRALIDVLAHSGEGVRIDIANSLWADEGLDFREPFLAANRTYYGAETAPVDLQSGEAAERINGWVSRHTEGKIDKLLDEPLSDDAIMLLLNAIYFDAGWASPFPEDDTKRHPFAAGDGRTAEVPTMFRDGKLPYLDGDGFQAVRIPYQGGELGMLVFVPDEGTPLSAFVDRLTPEAWAEWSSSFGEASGRLGLPKFRIEYETILNEPLQSLGMELAFDPDRADFGRMIDLTTGAYISQVKQKTFVDVAEQGTVAAAVTGVTMETASAPSETFELVVDRPFVFAIHDRRTDSVLFVGAVNDPAGK